MTDITTLAYASMVLGSALAAVGVWLARLRHADRALAADVATLFSAQMIETSEPRESLAVAE
jgi:hypothetical protein